MRTAVIGLGNRDRGDDALGLVVVDRLRAHDPDADLYAWERPELDLLEVLPRYDRVVIVDAARSGAPVGTLHHDLVPSADPGALGTHGFGLAGVLELADALDRVPDELHLLLVEIDAVEHGADLRPTVSVAADDVVARLVAALDAGGADVPR